MREGDSGVEAVIHRELVANADAFAALQRALGRHGVALTVLRLHDVLLWLSGSLRLTHAVALGRDDALPGSARTRSAPASRDETVGRAAVPPGVAADPTGVVTCTPDPPPCAATPQALDDAIAYLRDKVMPAVQGLDGFVGLSMLADRESGRCIATTAWESEEAMHDSESPLHQLRRGTPTSWVGGRRCRSGRSPSCTACSTRPTAPAPGWSGAAGTPRTASGCWTRSA